MRDLYLETLSIESRRFVCGAEDEVVDMDELARLENSTTEGDDEEAEQEPDASIEPDDEMEDTAQEPDASIETDEVK